MLLFRKAYKTNQLCSKANSREDPKLFCSDTPNAAKNSMTKPIFSKLIGLQKLIN